jgi:hypothetical protein
MVIFPREFESEQHFAEWLTQNRDELDLRGEFHTEESHPGDFYETAVFFEYPQDVEYVNGILRYFFQGEFAGEYWETQGHEGRLFVPYTDSTKSARDDIGDALPELWAILEMGTPVRKTNKAGPGTAGTRKWGPVKGRFWIAFS